MQTSTQQIHQDAHPATDTPRRTPSHRYTKTHTQSQIHQDAHPAIVKFHSRSYMRLYTYRGITRRNPTPPEWGSLPLSNLCYVIGPAPLGQTWDIFVHQCVGTPLDYIFYRQTWLSPTPSLAITAPSPSPSVVALTVHASIVRQLPLAQHESLGRVVEADVLGLAPRQDAGPIGGVAYGREAFASARFL